MVKKRLFILLVTILHALPTINKNATNTSDKPKSSSSNSSSPPPKPSIEPHPYPSTSPTTDCTNGCLDCDKKKLKCRKCDLGFKLENSSCHKCEIEGCASCFNTIYKCNLCLPRFYTSEPGTKKGDIQKCGNCIKNCLSCIEGGSCQVCENGYQLNGSFECEPKADMYLIGIIALGIILSLVFIWMAIKYCFREKGKKLMRLGKTVKEIEEKERIEEEEKKKKEEGEKKKKKPEENEVFEGDHVINTTSRLKGDDV